MANTFKDVVDRLRLTGPELSELFGVSAQTIRQAKLDPSKDGYRSPPRGWAQTLARIAKERGGELLTLAKELESQAKRESD